MIPTLAEARELLQKYNKEPFHLEHGETVSYVMGWFARRYDAENEMFWRVTGMLHDIDFELYPEEHCVRGITLLREENVDERIIKSALSHGWGMTGTPYEPDCHMEKILFAVDELTGLIGAAALMRPSKSVLDMELPSLKKKFKDKKFAAGCSRDTIIKGAELLGIQLDTLLSETLKAMQSFEESD